MTTLPGFFSTPGAAIPGMLWPGAPVSALSPPVFTFPALWSVQWAQAETLVTVAGIGATLGIAPAGPLAATGSVAGVNVTVTAAPVVPDGASVLITGATGTAAPQVTVPSVISQAPATGTFEPPDTEVLYPAPPAVIQPGD